MRKFILTLGIFFLISSLSYGSDSIYKMGPSLYKKYETSLSYRNSENEIIKVIIKLDSDPLENAKNEDIELIQKHVVDNGGYLGDQAFNNIQAWLPISKIDEVAKLNIIRTITLPSDIGQHGVTSEGLSKINVQNIHSYGIMGEGVKIGVIDLSYHSYNNIKNLEFPTKTYFKSFSQGTNYTTGDHGTSCAEIISDIVPNSELYLADINDVEVDFHNAINWFIANRLHVISSSIDVDLKRFCMVMEGVISSNLFSSNYALNQLAALNETRNQMAFSVNRLVANNITWVQSAGNSAETRWRGLYVDSDFDYSLNFSAYDNFNKIVYPPYFKFGNIIYVVAIWDLNDDYSSYDDFDLIIRNQYGNIVTQSRVNQYLNPIAAEACSFMPFPGNTYYIQIVNWNANSQEIGILVGCDGLPRLYYNTPRHTVNDGSLSPLSSVITVGAVPYYNINTIEPYSSRGPSYEGIIKPDIVGPARISTRSEGGSLTGTSYAAPHVAGICALVKQIHPSLNPRQVKTYLENTALDLGQPGKDNVFGSGLVQAPKIQTPQPLPVGSRVSLSGKVTNPSGMPLCALVLVNGKHDFSCDGRGSYSLKDIPLDSNGKITIQSFCLGKAPFSYTLIPHSVNNYNIVLNSEWSPLINASNVTCNSLGSSARIKGYLSYNGQPLNAMALANGKFMFTGNPKGYFDLTVPKNNNGKVHLQVYCANAMPYSKIYTPQ